MSLTSVFVRMRWAVCACMLVCLRAVVHACARLCVRSLVRLHLARWAHLCMRVWMRARIYVHMCVNAPATSLDLCLEMSDFWTDTLANHEIELAIVFQFRKNIAMGRRVADIKFYWCFFFTNHEIQNDFQKWRKLQKIMWNIWRMMNYKNNNSSNYSTFEKQRVLIVADFILNGVGKANWSLAPCPLSAILRRYDFRRENINCKSGFCSA